jgi:hypothetical protein
MRFVRIISLLLFATFMTTGLQAASLEEHGAYKLHDLTKYHDVGNIRMRVSNYGFFGSGDDITPQWPSLEYPKGGGVDYLYQGALWFGAKKIRRNRANVKLYWKDNSHVDVVAETDPTWTPTMKVVIDTLTSVGFDGDSDLYEFLPAYNKVETTAIGDKFAVYNTTDTLLASSIRKQRRGVDDDGDSRIDEDPPGMAFKFRNADELPNYLDSLGGKFLSEIPLGDEISIISSHVNTWFPLGFVDLGMKDPTDNYIFAMPTDDDDPLDNLVDEDGYPMSEQDFIGYYYDYSPFDISGQRDYGSYADQSDHYPLGIRVRQMSFQWSYEYIKNLVYVEFDITNMSDSDSLYDCAMGIYMDSDVGYQTDTAADRAPDDVSSYVKGDNNEYEFAYTYDTGADFESGGTRGYVGSRVCTPDPEQLKFACWTWDVSQGPDDFHPLDEYDPAQGTNNEKYALLTGSNPNDDYYISLREHPDAQAADPCDTRYLFAFYGDQKGLTTPSEESWNLGPGKTMKIVIAVFPGDTVEDLKKTAIDAKEIYQNPQTLTTVCLPDTCEHYYPYQPPAIPAMFIEQDTKGNSVNVWWDNRSEYTIDDMNIKEAQIGLQNIHTDLPSYNVNAVPGTPNFNSNAYISPQIGRRLRHDFQGYSIWGCSGSGEPDQWDMVRTWDKVETDTDNSDYNCVIDNAFTEFQNYGGVDLGRDTGLPGFYPATASDLGYYRLDAMYELTPVAVGDTLYGKPLYDPMFNNAGDDMQATINNMAANWDDSSINTKYDVRYDRFQNEQLIFRNPAVRADIYLALVQDSLITIPSRPDVVSNHIGQSYLHNEYTVKDRLSRRYYEARIDSPPKGVEYYVSVTARDRGIPQVRPVAPLETGKDANMQVIFPGPSGNNKMDNIYVVPNPYVGIGKFDGYREKDDKGDRGRRLWFVNLPEKCTVRIYTLAGDLVDTIDHNGAHTTDVISLSKAATQGISPSGMHEWDLLSRHGKNRQVIVSGVYLYSVEDKASGDVKVGKFVIIR